MPLFPYCYQLIDGFPTVKNGQALHCGAPHPASYSFDVKAISIAVKGNRRACRMSDSHYGHWQLDVILHTI